MTQGLHYPILINPPKKVNITFEQFDKLSCIGLASLFCNYQYLIGKTEGEYRFYCREGYERPFFFNQRFKDLKWFSYPTVEMVYCKIPSDHPLVEVINRKFSHLIME